MFQSWLRNAGARAHRKDNRNLQSGRSTQAFRTDSRRRALRPGLTIPELAKEIDCTRATLHNYRKGSNKTIEALLLFDLADALGVSARWLLGKGGAMEKFEALTPEQARVLQTFGQLQTEDARDYWISQGEELRRRQSTLFPSAADPYNGEKPPVTLQEPARSSSKEKQK